jgi:hypothetical protein
MILSKQNQFVFIKGSKVAGTSVETALSAICGPDDIITPFVAIDERRRIEAGGRPAQNYSSRPKMEAAFVQQVISVPEDKIGSVDRPNGRFTNHMTLRAVKKRVGDLSGYFIFGIDRNPYAKVISRASMKATFDKYRMGQTVQADPESLKKGIEWVLRSGVGRVKNLQRFLEEDGELRIRVLRYENLAEEFNALIEERGWSGVPPLPHVKKGIMASERDFAQTLTTDQIGRINELFADEFAAYGYDMIKVERSVRGATLEADPSDALESAGGREGSPLQSSVASGDAKAPQKRSRRSMSTDDVTSAEAPAGGKRAKKETKAAVKAVKQQRGELRQKRAAAETDEEKKQIKTEMKALRKQMSALRGPKAGAEGAEAGAAGGGKKAGGGRRKKKAAAEPTAA